MQVNQDMASADDDASADDTATADDTAPASDDALASAAVAQANRLSVNASQITQVVGNRGSSDPAAKSVSAFLHLPQNKDPFVTHPQSQTHLQQQSLGHGQELPTAATQNQPQPQSESYNVPQGPAQAQVQPQTQKQHTMPKHNDNMTQAAHNLPKQQQQQQQPINLASASQHQDATRQLPLPSCGTPKQRTCGAAPPVFAYPALMAGGTEQAVVAGKTVSDADGQSQQHQTIEDNIFDNITKQQVEACHGTLKDLYTQQMQQKSAAFDIQRLESALSEVGHEVKAKLEQASRYSTVWELLADDTNKPFCDTALEQLQCVKDSVKTLQLRQHNLQAQLDQANTRFKSSKLSCVGTCLECSLRTSQKHATSVLLQFVVFIYTAW